MCRPTLIVLLLGIAGVNSVTAASCYPASCHPAGIAQSSISASASAQVSVAALEPIFHNGSIEDLDAILGGGGKIFDIPNFATIAFNGFICGCNVEAAAQTFAQTASSSSGISYSSLAALVFEQRVASVEVITEVLAISYGYGGSAAVASARAIALAVGQGYLSGQDAVSALASAYSNGGGDFISSIADEAASTYCGQMKQAFTDAYQSSEAINLHGFQEVLSSAQESADCYRGCCCVTENC